MSWPQRPLGGGPIWFIVFSATCVDSRLPLVFLPRDAMIEKKKNLAAARRRSPSPDNEFSEADIMGGGGSFQAA